MLDAELRSCQKPHEDAANLTVKRAAAIGFELEYELVTEEEICQGCKDGTLAVFERGLCPQCAYTTVRNVIYRANNGELVMP